MSDRMKSGRGEFLKMFLEHLPLSQVLAKNKNGNTPLHLACILGRPDLVQILLEHAPRMQVKLSDSRGNLPLHLLVLPHSKRDLDFRSGSCMPYGGGSTLVGLSDEDFQRLGRYSKERGEIMRLLLAHASDQQIHQENSAGSLPIHLMSLWPLGFLLAGSPEMEQEAEWRLSESYFQAMNTLLSYDSMQVSCEDAHGNLPIHLALAQIAAHEPIRSMQRKYYYHSYVTDSPKPLSYTSYCRYISCALKALLQTAPELQLFQQNASKMYPIHLACASRSSQPLLCLLDYQPSAQMELKDANEHLPAEIAIRYGSAEVGAVALRLVPDQFPALKGQLVWGNEAWSAVYAELLADGTIDWPDAPAFLNDKALQIVTRRAVKSARSSLGKRDRNEAGIPGESEAQ